VRVVGLRGKSVDVLAGLTAVLAKQLLLLGTWRSP
jgi:hypothetical protein